MRRAMEEMMSVDAVGCARVLESFFWRLTEVRSTVDVNIAAGIALEELKEIGCELGKSRASAPSQY